MEHGYAAILSKRVRSTDEERQRLTTKLKEWLLSLINMV